MDHHLNGYCRKLCISYTLQFKSNDTCLKPRRITQPRQSTPGRARLPPATSTALRLQRTSAINLHPPPSATGSSTQRLLALPPRELLRAPTAQSDRCGRERGVGARRYGGAASARALYGVQLGVDRGICGLPEALRPGAPGERARLRLRLRLRLRR